MKQFAFPRRFKSAASLLSTLTRNNRELLAFLNTFTVRFQSDASAVVLPGDLTVVGTTTLADEDWIAPTLLNSWVNWVGSFRLAGYKKTPDGAVHIRGLVKSGSGITAIILNLPAGYRPDKIVVLPAVSAAGAAQIRIAADGNVHCEDGGSTSWTSIEVTFHLD